VSIAVGILFWCLVGGILGAVIAQSKNRSAWEGAFLGVLLGLLGVLIVALLPKIAESQTPAGASGVAARPGAIRHATREERPAIAQARLDEAEKAVAARAYPKAFAPMYDESYEAVRRGDVEALRTMLDLANKIEVAPDAHARIKKDARDLAERLQSSIASFSEPDPELAEDGSAVGVSPDTLASENGTQTRSALGIVRERYARGEISREEFQQLKADLAE
jgi:hypothetical protein